MRHVYGEEDNRREYIEPAIVAGTVIWCDGNRTSSEGDPQSSVLFKLDGSGCHVFDNLTDSRKAKWRIDTFCKATGMDIKKGDEVDISEETVLGLRVWLDIGVQDDKKVEGKKKNVIIKYITDRGVPPSLDVDEPNTGNTLSPESAPTEDNDLADDKQLPF